MSAAVKPQRPLTLERVPGENRYRFHSASGVIYAVYDVIYHNGHHRVFPLGSRKADSRIFRPKEGHFWMLYRFGANEKREPDVWELQRQLQTSVFYTPEKFDTSTITPR